jgi:hypothetical protein
MFQKLADHIAACFEQAIASERRARGATDPKVRQSYEEIARGWRHLAASYQFSELKRFLLDSDRAKKLPAPSIAPEMNPAEGKPA